MERQPISREGWEKKKQEIAELEDKFAEVSEMVRIAREEGDLSENAEYHGQRETQGMIQAKLNQLKSQLSLCYIVDKTSMPKGVVTYGSTVTVKDLDDGSLEKYELVGPGEEDYEGDVMKILTTSPIAQCLVGKKAGDQSEVDVPRGRLRMEIVEIADAE